MALLSKNTHETIKENLSAYLDGQLDATTAATVQVHLASCAECAWEKQTLEQIRRLMAQVPRVAPPRSFVLREALVAAPSRAGFFTTTRMLYLRGVTAAVGVLLSAVLAGDVWLRPIAQVPMATAPSAPQTEMLTIGATAEAMPTDQVTFKAAPQPEGTPALDGSFAAATPAPDDGVRAVGGGPEATQEVAGQEFAVNDRGGVRAPFWADLRLWRVAEGMLGAMFIVLVAITATGWRRVARLN